MTLTCIENSVEQVLRELKGLPIKVMSEQEAEKTVEGMKPGDHIFRQDPSGEVYLAGLGAHGEVHHMRLAKDEQGWEGFNGGWYKAESLKKLVCLCLDQPQSE